MHVCTRGQASEQYAEATRRANKEAVEEACRRADAALRSDNLDQAVRRMCHGQPAFHLHSASCKLFPVSCKLIMGVLELQQPAGKMFCLHVLAWRSHVL